MSKIRISRLAATLAVGLAASLSLAACGSDDGGSSGSGSGTIKLGLVTSVGTRVDFKDVVAAANAGAEAINSNGGIDGKKVKIIFCNESLDPNKGRACVRDLINQKITAMVGASVSTMEADLVKLLDQAKIANFAPGTYGATANDPNSYLLNPGWNFNQPATVQAAVNAGADKIAWAPFDLPLNQAYGPVYEKGSELAGGSFAGTVKIPATTTDMAPIAAQIADTQANAVVMNLSGSLIVNLVKALAQLGWDGKWLSGDAAFNDGDLDQFPAGWLDKAIFVSPFPPLNYSDKYPGLQQMKDDFAAATKAGIEDVPATDRFVRAWASTAYFGVIAAGKVLEAADGTEAAAFIKSANSIKDIDLGGVIPAWTPSASASAVDTRVANPNMWFYHWENGKQVLDDGPVDVAKLWDDSMS